MKKIAFLLFVLSSNFAFGQVTYIPVTVAFPQIVMGGDPGGQNYVTLLQVVNNNSAFIIGHVSLFSDNGSPLAVLFDGQGPPQSTMDLKLNSGQSRQIQITLNGSITAGWMEISYSPSDALTTVVLQFRSGTTLLSEIGINPAFNTMAATDIAAETDTALNTGIAVANPDTVTAYILATLWDPNTGGIMANSTLTLPPDGHIAKFLTELFPGVLNINQIRAEVSLDQCSTSACSSAGGNGFFATAVRLNGNQFTTIPVADRPPDGDQVRILPQVAFGGPADGVNMMTVLYLTTNVSTGVFGVADIFDDTGNPLAASANGAAPASSITLTVPGNRVTRVVLSGDQTLRSGWLRLTLPGTVHLIVSAVFQTFVGPNLIAEASVLESPQVTRGLIYVKSQSGSADVGVAFANSQSTANTISLKLFNQDGFVFATKDITLPANGHVARFVTELFPELASLANFDGALSIYSSTSFSAIALRLTTDKIATLPIAANGMYRPAITGLRVPKTQRSPAQVNFEIDVTDYDSDIAAGSSTSVSGVAYLDFGSAGYDMGQVTMNGAALVNRATGTLSGTFQPPNVTGAVAGGTQAVFYIYILDSAGNQSNFVGISVKF
jgi:hypothetical protein